MIRRAALAFVVLALAGPAAAQSRAPINIRVSFDQYNAEANTFSGGVVVSASVCRRVDYNVNVAFAGAKDAEAALKQTRGTVNRLIGSIQQAAAHCPA